MAGTLVDWLRDRQDLIDTLMAMTSDAEIQATLERASANFAAAELTLARLEAFDA